MALKAGYKGIHTVGPGLEYDNTTGHLSLTGESDLSLDNLKDVEITEPLEGDILVYDGEEWINEQIDMEPVEDSAKPIASGAVYPIAAVIPSTATSSNKLSTASDVDAIWDANAVLGAHNVMPFDPVLTAVNGVTPTKRDNGTIRLNNTLTATAWIGLSQPTSHPATDTYKTTLKKGSYKIICKSSQALSNNVSVSIYSPSATPIVGNPTFNSGTDNKATFTLNADTNIYVGVRVASGVSLSDFDIQCYIIMADDAVEDFAPYAMTNFQLTQNKASNSDIQDVYEVMGENGCKNRYNNSVTKTDISGTSHDDTATGVRVYNTTAGTYKGVFVPISIPKNTDITLSLSVAYTSGAGMFRVEGSNDNFSTNTIIDGSYPASAITANGDFSKTFNSGNYSAYRIRVNSTQATSEEGDISYSNIMLRLAQDTDPTYQPYAMTNFELTNRIKSAPFSGTTSANGNLQITSDVKAVICAMVDSTNSVIATPYLSAGKVFIHATSDASTPVAVSETAISGTYYYIDE